MAAPGGGGPRSRGRSFGTVAAGYATLRPGYPADAVAHLLGRGRPQRVLDVGAGTGLLTEVVLAAGHDVVAVDPSPEMLTQLTARLTGVGTAAGTAEALPLGDATVGAVVAGQAAHWFDPVPAAREIRRVLRPGGILGLIWNTRDERVPWVAALGAAVAGEARGHEADQGVAGLFAAELGACLTVADSAVVQHLTPDEVVGGIATRSYVAVMDEDGRAAFLDGIRDLPYRTAAYRLTPR